MLQPCANPGCSVHFPSEANQCPVCGTAVVRLELDTESGDPAEIRSERPGEMTALERRGREILSLFIVLILLADLASGLLAIGLSGASVLPRAIRVIVTVFLLSAVYSGSLRARRIGIVLFGLGSVAGLAVVLILQNLLAALWLLPLLALYFSFALFLENSGSLNAFLAYQRRRRPAPKSEAVQPATPPAVPPVCPTCGSALDAHTLKCPACGENPAASAS